MSHNFVVNSRHNNIRMTSVFFKMAGVNAQYFKVTMNLFKHWYPNLEKYARKSLRKRFSNLSLGSLFDNTLQSLVMPNSDPRDRFVYPILKLHDRLLYAQVLFVNFQEPVYILTNCLSSFQLHRFKYDTGRALQALVKAPALKTIDKKWHDEDTVRTFFS